MVYTVVAITARRTARSGIMLVQDGMALQCMYDNPIESVDTQSRTVFV